MASYPPNFNDQGIIDLCVNAGNPATVDGFYKTINDATGNTNGSMDDVWKRYITDVLGFEYVGQHPAHYGLNFGDVLTAWSLDDAILPPEVFTLQIPNGATGSGSGFHRCTATTDGVTAGDFPTATAPGDFFLGNAGFGHVTSNDNIGGLWFSLDQPLEQLVANATLNVRTAAGTVAGYTHRVYAVMKPSPTRPEASREESALALRATDGWSVAYAEFTSALTTNYALDVTDLVNELILAHGTTGTSIMFAFAAYGGDWTANEALVLNSAAYIPTLSVQRSLNHRDYQRTAIEGGTVIYYWPFDALDATLGDTQFRVVTTTDRGVQGTDDPIPFADIGGGSLLPKLSRFAMRPSTVWFELDSGESGDNARRLVAGARATPAVTIGKDPAGPDPGGPLYNYYVMDARTYSYLCMMQYVDDGVASTGLLWDYYGDVAFSSRIQHSPGVDSAAFYYPSGSALPDNITLPGTHVPTNGRIITAGWYYDATENLLYGFRCLGVTDIIEWTAGISYVVSGAASPQEVSGIASPIGDLQGVVALEFDTAPALTTIQTAVTQMRTLWKSGVKSLPPILYA